MVSKQRLLQLKWISQGLCCRCRGKRNLSKNYCDKCLFKIREVQRTKKGCKEWVKGNRGRPPLEAKMKLEDVPKS